ncbi:MAG: hypothetical protein IJX78_02415 [Bacilli bacterium]|nr:hypothetical protein [Bacilli bacterium]
MKKFKRIFFGVALLVVLCIFTIGTISVNAARMIREDDNDLGVVLYSLNDKEYYVELDEENNCGYVIEVKNGEENVIGTCSITVIFSDETNEVIEYTDVNTDTHGSIVIVITDNVSGEGYIQNVDGILENIFEEDEKIIFIE